jgi:predicted Zn-dependent peptidase
MRRYYVANNMVLCVAGAVDERAVSCAALRHLGGLPSGAIVPALPAQPAADEGGLHCVDSPGPQTDVRLSFSTFGASDPRYLALELLMRVLDDGMSTRLHRRICEELGLAYEVFATLEPYEECGVLDVGAAVEHSKVPVFMRNALRLLRELADQPVSKHELDKAKRRYQWQLEAILDDAQAMCAHYGQRALLGQEGHLGALRQQVQSTTAAQLRAVAREILQRPRLHVVTVGALSSQREQVKRALSALGPATSTRRRHARS